MLYTATPDEPPFCGDLIAVTFENPFGGASISPFIKSPMLFNQDKAAFGASGAAAGAASGAAAGAASLAAAGAAAGVAASAAGFSCFTAASNVFPFGPSGVLSPLSKING